MNPHHGYSRSVPSQSCSLLSRRAWIQSTAASFVCVAAGTFAGTRAFAQESKTATSGKMLIFRNIPSWNRSPDFEDAAADLRLPFDVKPSSEMKAARMAEYRVIVIPGAQWETGYYADFAAAAQAFDEFVRAGGTLLLELNGAEGEGIKLPGGPSMVRHRGTDNLIVLPRHPAVAPLGKRPRITANLASHGYLTGVPADAMVLAAVVPEGSDTVEKDKPTYVEYAHGKGRIIAACQCFHDRDESGRGPLMPAALSYAMAGKWYSPD